MNTQLAFVWSACLIVAFCAPDASGRGLSAWDVAHLQSVDAVAVSPDGSHVAYTLSVPREPMADENGPAWTELHVYDREDDVSLAFVSGEVKVSNIQWTRDGQYIGYRAKRGDDEDVSNFVVVVYWGSEIQLDEDQRPSASTVDGTWEHEFSVLFEPEIGYLPAAIVLGLVIVIAAILF